jgi:hypothetical protein
MKYKNTRTFFVAFLTMLLMNSCGYTVLNLSSHSEKETHSVFQQQVTDSLEYRFSKICNIWKGVAMKTDLGHPYTHDSINRLVFRQDSTWDIIYKHERFSGRWNFNNDTRYFYLSLACSCENKELNKHFIGHFRGDLLWLESTFEGPHMLGLEWQLVPY